MQSNEKSTAIRIAGPESVKWHKKNKIETNVDKTDQQFKSQTNSDINNKMSLNNKNIVKSDKNEKKNINNSINSKRTKGMIEDKHYFSNNLIIISKKLIIN
jgi:hypothetical protein